MREARFELWTKGGIIHVSEKRVVRETITTKNPEGATSGFFFSVFARWINPQADCLSSSFQPFADSISDYASHDSRKERE